MSEPVKIAIIVDGGIVQDVLSAGVPVEFVIVDYDVDGYDEERIAQVPQGDGTTAEGAVTAPAEAENHGAFVLAAHNGFAEENNK